MYDFTKEDYWRAVMYSKLRETLLKVDVDGVALEFGGSNGIIQGMLPKLKWEVRGYPPYDITKEASYEQDWDVIVADQILEHTERPWEAMRLIGEHTKKMAIITVPFMIGIHNSPVDCWRMTPRTIRKLAEPYFKDIDIQTWGNSTVNNWHAMYRRTSRLIQDVSNEELMQGINLNDVGQPFVIWSILKK